MSRARRPKVINSHIVQPCSNSSDRRQGSSCNSAGVTPTCVTVIAPPFSLLIGGGDGTGANRIRPVIALPEKKGGGILSWEQTREDTLLWRCFCLHNLIYILNQLCMILGGRIWKGCFGRCQNLCSPEHPYTKATASFVAGKRRHYVLFRLPQGSVEKFDLSPPPPAPNLSLDSLLFIDRAKFYTSSSWRIFMGVYLYPPKHGKIGVHWRSTFCGDSIIAISLPLSFYVISVFTFFYPLKFMIVAMYSQ